MGGGAGAGEVLILSLSAHTIYCIYSSMIDPKPVEFRGSALDDLRAFPVLARREAGHQLDQLQHGMMPDDWKPMPSVGQGVQEIRIRDVAGVFRVIYLAKLADAIYVLHCFQKKHRRPARPIWIWPVIAIVYC